MFAMGEKLRALPSWREMDVFAKLRPHCLTEIEQDEEHCLEAMTSLARSGREIEAASAPASRAR